MRGTRQRWAWHEPHALSGCMTAAESESKSSQLWHYTAMTSTKEHLLAAVCSAYALAVQLEQLTLVSALLVARKSNPIHASISRGDVRPQLTNSKLLDAAVKLCDTATS